MKTIAKKIGATAAVVLGGLLLFHFISVWRTYRSFSNLEQNAKKAIPGAEIQKWATQIVAQHPNPEYGHAELRLSDLSPPLPRPLLGLYRSPPNLYVYETTTNHPGHVRLIWGGGNIGHCGFEIGPTNFVGKGNPWQNGVYFWSDVDDR
jgi:hypothetical protein